MVCILYKMLQKIVNKDKLGYILLTKKVTQEVDITQNDTLLSYLPSSNKEIFNGFDMDINKGLNIEGNAEEK